MVFSLRSECAYCSPLACTYLCIWLQLFRCPHGNCGSLFHCGYTQWFSLQIQYSEHHPGEWWTIGRLQNSAGHMMLGQRFERPIYSVQLHKSRETYVHWKSIADTRLEHLWSPICHHTLSPKTLQGILPLVRQLVFGRLPAEHLPHYTLRLILNSRRPCRHMLSTV